MTPGAGAGRSSGESRGDGRAEALRGARSAYPGSECVHCSHVRVTPGKHSVFLRCDAAREDPRLRRYPPQPVRNCPGFERIEGGC